MNTNNAFKAVGALRILLDFTVSNARRFYSSVGNPLAVKGLTTPKRRKGIMERTLINDSLESNQLRVLRLLSVLFFFFLNLYFHMVKKPKNSSGFWYNIKYNYLTIINNNKYVSKSL